MTDRYNVLTVILEHDMRDDDAEHLINAIKMMRNVLDVKGNVSDLHDAVAYSRVKQELSRKLIDILYSD